MNNQMPTNFFPGGPGPVMPPIWNNPNNDIRQLENRVMNLEREVRRLNGRVTRLERNLNVGVPYKENDTYQTYQTDSYNMM